MPLTDRIETLVDTPLLAPLEKGMAMRARHLARLGDGAMDTLRGTWLGHPLHLALSDVPLGAWTVALAMDAVDVLAGEERMAEGAEMAIGVGLAGAGGAALTGLVDWSRTTGRERRLGVAHGALSGGATILFAASLALRKAGARPQGRLAALAGFGVALVAAALGGSLAVKTGTGAEPPQS